MTRPLKSMPRLWKEWMKFGSRNGRSTGTRLACVTVSVCVCGRLHFLLLSLHFDLFFIVVLLMPGLGREESLLPTGESAHVLVGWARSLQPISDSYLVNVVCCVGS